MKTVVGEFNSSGYIICVEDNHEIIDEYVAGNCRYDSGQTLPVGAAGTIDIVTIEEYANQTAKDMAEERGAKLLSVSRIDEY